MDNPEKYCPLCGAHEFEHSEGDVPWTPEWMDQLMRSLSAEEKDVLLMRLVKL